MPAWPWLKFSRGILAIRIQKMVVSSSAPSCPQSQNQRSSSSPSPYVNVPSSPNPPSPSPSVLCIGLVLTLFACNLHKVDSANPEASTVYSVQWNASAGANGNGGFYQSANLSGGIISSATNVPPTTTAKQSTVAPVHSSTQSPNNPWNSLGIGLKYGMALPLNLLCTLLQLYVSLFGRRMEMSGIRWFTVYYNLWNIYQIILISDTADSSPWKGWLNDTRFVDNKSSLELFTMSFFPLGVILVVPLFLLAHFCFCCPLRWIPWLLFFLLLSFLPTFLYNGAISFNFPLVHGNATLNMGNGTTLDLVDTYAFAVISLASVSVLYLIPMIVAAIFFFVCYRLLNRFNPKSNHPLRCSRMLDLILLCPFILVVLAMHIPCFVVNLSGFFIVNIYPSLSTTLIPLLTGSGAVGNSTGSPTGGSPTGGSPTVVTNPFASPWMMNVLNVYNQILMYKDDTEMFLPVVEFVASFLFIRMYREQYLALFSCYAFYKDDKNGALGICWSGRQRTLVVPASAITEMAVQLQPQDPRLWAQPVRK